MGQNIRGISLGEHIRDIRGTVSRTGLVLTQGLAVLIEFRFRVFCWFSKRERLLIWFNLNFLALTRVS